MSFFLSWSARREIKKMHTAAEEEAALQLERSAVCAVAVTGLEEGRERRRERWREEGKEKEEEQNDDTVMDSINVAT